MKRVVGKGFLRVGSVWEKKFAEDLESFESDKSFQELTGRVFIEGRRTVPDVSVTFCILHRWMKFKDQRLGFYF